jgi:hypothetical protein
MRVPDLLKLDDFMLRGARISALLVVIGGGLAFLLPEDVRGSTTMFVCGLGFVALAPLAMTLVGLDLRKREQRAVALLRLVDRHVELSAGDLVLNSEFTRETLETAVRDLNSSGLRHVVWDRDQGLIQDGRLRQSRLHFETCASCGVKIALDVPLHEAAAARCSTCGSSLDAREIDDEKRAVMSEISRRSDSLSESRRPESRFHVSLFLLLLVACWPLALVYVMKCWQPPACEVDS